MNNLLYDLLLTIISAILGALFGVFIPKLLKDKTETTEIGVDKQLVFSQIHIEQKQYTVNMVGCQSKTVIVRIRAKALVEEKCSSVF